MNNPIYDGHGIPFEPNNSEIGRIISLIFSHSHERGSSGLLNRKNLKNVLWSTSDEYLTSFRSELQRVLIYAYENRAGVNEELFTLFVHQTLSLLPFAYPSEEFEIQVPVKIGENWDLKPYRLDKKFELAHQLLVSPIPAFGLLSEEGGPPLLLFMGTTYPAGEGFIGTLLSDFIPGCSVGALAIHCARDELNSWLAEHGGAYAMGLSLGGALSLHVARLFGNKVAQVFAFVPPGLYPRELAAFEGSETQIHLLLHEGDYIAHHGFFPQGENVKLYRVHEDRPSSSLSAHARIFLTSANIRVVCDSVEEENNRFSRKLFTGLHMIVSPFLFASMLPFYLLVTLFKLLGLAIVHCCTALLVCSRHV